MERAQRHPWRRAATDTVVAVCHMPRVVPAEDFIVIVHDATHAKPIRTLAPRPEAAPTASRCPTPCQWAAALPRQRSRAKILGPLLVHSRTASRQRHQQQHCPQQLARRTPAPWARRPAGIAAPPRPQRARGQRPRERQLTQQRDPAPTAAPRGHSAVLHTIQNHRHPLQKPQRPPQHAKPHAKRARDTCPRTATGHVMRCAAQHLTPQKRQIRLRSTYAGWAIGHSSGESGRASGYRDAGNAPPAASRERTCKPRHRAHARPHSRTLGQGGQ